MQCWLHFARVAGGFGLGSNVQVIRGGEVMPGRRGRFQKKIDYTHWTIGNAESGSLGAGSVGVTLFSAQHQPETLLRLRGNLLAKLEGVQSGGQGILVTCGIILVPEGTGTTVLWSPFTDADAPWIWFDGFYLGYEEYVIDVISAQCAACYRSVIDSKAMRIVRNQEVQAVFQNTTILTAASVRAQLVVRGLTGH